MARDITAGMITKATGAQLEPRFFVFMDFPSGAVRAWDGLGNKSWDGETWTGVGTLGQISLAKETVEVRSEGCIISLNGVPAATVSLALTDKIRGEVVEIYLADDSGGTITADPILIFKGRMDHMTIVESGDGGENDTAIINVHCESHLIDLGRASEWRYSHEHQQELFSGDDGFEFAATIPDLELHWMSKNAERSIPISTAQPRRGNA